MEGRTMVGDIRYTPYGDLIEGDEFIRLASRPVLLAHVDGVRRGAKLTLTIAGRELTVDIHRMVRTPGGYLDEELAQ